MSFLGTLARGVVGAVTGFVAGGPAGAVVGATTAIATGGAPAPMPLGLQTPTTTLPQGGGFPLTGVCPPGTRCRGILSTNNICIGSCEPFTMPTFPEPFVPIAPPMPGQPAMPQQIQVSNGACPCPTCCTPSGQRGRRNKSGYYVFGRCGDPRNATYVPPGTRCVTPRRMNPANGRAARRAVQRVNATLGLLRGVERSMQRLARPRKRKKVAA